MIQTVRFGRAVAIAGALLALLAFAVASTFVHDWVELIVGGVLVGAIWGFGMLALFSSTTRDAAPPIRIPEDALPPKASLLRALIPGVALFALLDAFLLAFMYAQPHAPGLFLGMILGGPIPQWGHAVRARRAERRLGGTLWVTPDFSWSRRSRERYLALPD